MDFCKNHLIVKSLEFSEQGLYQSKSGCILLALQLTRNRWVRWESSYIQTTYRAANLVSKLCFRNILFSLLAHAILSVKVVIWICWLSGMALKKFSSVRTSTRLSDDRPKEPQDSRTKLCSFCFCRRRHESSWLGNEVGQTFSISEEPEANYSRKRSKSRETNFSSLYFWPSSTREASCCWRVSVGGVDVEAIVKMDSASGIIDKRVRVMHGPWESFDNISAKAPTAGHWAVQQNRHLTVLTFYSSLHVAYHPFVRSF